MNLIHDRDLASAWIARIFDQSIKERQHVHKILTLNKEDRQEIFYEIFRQMLDFCDTPSLSDFFQLILNTFKQKNISIIKKIYLNWY